jgi:queuosine precursor transporter
MLPQFVSEFFTLHQDLLWIFTVIIDLSIAIILYRTFGKMGLYAIVVLNLMLTNLQGPKVIDILGMQTSMGVILYAGIYFATDMISEKYGQREANRAVMIGFSVSVIVVVIMSISLMFQPTTRAEQAEYALNMHNAVASLFDFTPHFVFGSLAAYFISQHLDVYIFHYLKEKTQGRHLWLRNNASTITSQAVDTVIYGLIVWWPLVGLETAMQLAVAKYIFKVIIAILDTPFIYIARRWDVSHRDWHFEHDPQEQEKLKAGKLEPVVETLKS